MTGARAVLETLRVDFRPPDPHPELGPGTLTVTGIVSTPQSSHTVQDRVEITLDRRLLPGETPQGAVADIAALLAPLDGMLDPASGRPLSITCQARPAMHPSLIPADHPLVRAVAASFAAVTGRELATIHASNAFDQGLLNRIGVPAATWGPGESAFAHSTNDLASVLRVTEAAQVYAHLMLTTPGAKA